jgi:hypothetical protein
MADRRPKRPADVGGNAIRVAHRRGRGTSRTSSPYQLNGASIIQAGSTPIFPEHRTKGPEQ